MLPWWLSSRESACNAGDASSIPGSERFPGEGNGNLLQYSCLENPIGGGAWQATDHGVTKSWTRLSHFTFFLFILSVETESCATVVVDLQVALKKFRVESQALCAPGQLVEQVFR